MQNQKSSLGKHIRRIAIVNALLFLYYISTSFSCFLILSVGLFVIATDSPVESFKNLIDCRCQKNSIYKQINETFSKFAQFTIVQQFLGIIFFKFALEFSWYLPTWLIIFVAAELYATWHLLEDFGVLALVKQHHKKVHVQLKKVAQMIPKYKAE